MEEGYHIPQIVQLNEQTFAFQQEHWIQKGQPGFIVLDLMRKFEDPDLSRLPAKLMAYSTLEQAYLIRKYEVVLGEFHELW